jgi:hypothetical protein
MTLPAAFPLSMSQIATELGLSLPLSINHPWVIALAGKTALPVSFSDLLGKSGHCNASGTVRMDAGGGNIFYLVNVVPNVQFFDSQISQIIEQQIGPPIGVTAANTPTAYTGSLIVTNTTLNRSSVLTYVGSGEWAGDSGIGLYGNDGQTYNFTIYPHS